MRYIFVSLECHQSIGKVRFGYLDLGIHIAVISIRLEATDGLMCPERQRGNTLPECIVSLLAMTVGTGGLFGAFPLRPTGDSKSEGITGLRQFIDKVIDHVATQASQHERARYWARESYQDEAVPSSREAASFLEQPPADTRVLLGYIKNRKHRDWIRQEALYNLRADEERDGSVGLDSDELSADLLLLYGREMDTVELWTLEGAPQLFTLERMLASDYPRPNGEQYFCLHLGREVTQQLPVTTKSLQILRLHERISKRAFGSPMSLTWQKLLDSI